MRERRLSRSECAFEAWKVAMIVIFTAPLSGIIVTVIFGDPYGVMMLFLHLFGGPFSYFAVNDILRTKHGHEGSK
ncbi:hypothetical protein [Sinorhizobium meliloti]|uniref:hypothetical protein n=1 Tax=Rhizobium meliloti TaxID=382 RepID=UPI000FDC0D62|nr:hypothetical protein [Sinorhizobium meliloti]RVI91812.1 hypothetical protein CN190_03460 [Sinorhizobium meliloti]